MPANMLSAENRQIALENVDSHWDVVLSVGTFLDTIIAVQEIVSGIDEESVSGTDFALTAALYALNEEVHELGRDLMWKPWKKEKKFDTVNAIKELSDMLAFLGLVLINVAERTNISKQRLSELIALQYMATSRDNVERLVKEQNKIPRP